jgi:DNA topoisomerase-3
MIVLLAEKPSVARDLASFLGASSRHEGYFEGNGYQVTWALGHLVELQEPADYDPALKAWSLQTLPFIPRQFALKPRGDARARQQLAIVTRLFRAAERLICATDAGREGELIFRYILDATNCTHKPAYRLWLSSLTTTAIRKAFESLRPLADYDNLYAAAKCRSESDWIVGLNATRYYTVRFGSRGLLWSLGRVQTPVLAMIVRRDDEIRTFKPHDFWELLTTYRATRFRYAGDRFNKLEDATELLQRIHSHPLTVTAVEYKPETVLPPQLYDLTELQRDMNRRYGMSAADTLQAAQALYEAKLITYPRTDSRYLSSDVAEKIPELLRRLQSIKSHEIAKLNLGALALNGRIVNDQKVTDHHAIIPTGVVPQQLPERQRKVYDAVVTRLIAAFYPPCTKQVTTVDAVIQGIPFRARGVRVVSPGWTLLYPRNVDPKGDGSDQEMPQFVSGEQGPHEPHIKQGQTTPPSHYTENTLLGAMETAGKLVDDSELKEVLKEKGLGTPATRAAIIETLLQRQYICRQGKNLIGTDLGRYLVAIIRDKQLKSPELTGEWESQLKKIEAGKKRATDFNHEIAAYTQQMIQSSTDMSLDLTVLGNCPRCGQPVIAGKNAFGCSAWRSGCPFVLQPVFRGLTLDVDQIRQLLQWRVTTEPLQLADGLPFVIHLLDSGELVDIPIPSANTQNRSKPTRERSPQRRPPASSRSPRSSTGNAARGRQRSSTTRGQRPSRSTKSLGPCPLCQSPVIDQTKSYSCRRWREGCMFKIWKEMAGAPIAPSTVEVLLRDGTTAVLSGFRSKAGRPFSARLAVRDGRVTFEFEK